VKTIITRIVLFLGVCFCALPASAFIDINLQMQLGNPSGAIVDTNNHNHYLVQRSVEALDFSDSLGEPVWASWDLTAADIGSAPRSSSFFTDNTLPPNFYHVTDNDYTGVGAIFFTRGHMCPSEDRTDNVTDNDAVFLMDNIIPQDGTNNSGVWGTFEGYCRSLTSANELLIICGPSGLGTTRIPSGKAVIPDYTWKIAVVVPTNSGTALSRITSTTRVIALKIPNSAAATNSWPTYVTTAAQIEADTGLTFFTALPTDVANALRNKVDGPPIVSGFTPTNGMPGDTIIVTGMNLDSAVAVTFDGIAASFTINSGNQITAKVPTNGFNGPIGVTTTIGSAVSTNNFIITGNGNGGGGGITFSGVLTGWDVSGSTNFGISPLPPTTTAPGLTAPGLVRGGGVTTTGSAAGRAWGGVGFSAGSESAATNANQFVTFSVIPAAGEQVSITSVNQFDYRRSTSGPPNGELQYAVGSGPFTDAAPLSYSSSAAGGASLGPIDLSSVAALQNVGPGTNITFRIVNYGGGSSGTWYVYDKSSSSALDLAISGSVTPIVSLPPLLTWRQLYFGTTNNSGTAADNYVASGDGLPNLLKYALGLNPNIAATNAVVGDISTGYLRLTASHNTNATDVTLTGEVSGDLMTWTTEGTVIDQNSTVFQVQDTVPVTGGTNRFMRLRVTNP